ncbi:MAG: beta-L-arabinofuranosidase domain-containing protein [Blautia massiliensis (ex Durand et al. 2017)]
MQQNLGEHDDTADVHYRRNQACSGFRERFTTDYDLPNSTNYSETCASIGVMMFGQRMAAITGDASYYDYVEKALYNTVIAGNQYCRRPVLLCKPS